MSIRTSSATLESSAKPARAIKKFRQQGDTRKNDVEEWWIKLLCFNRVLVIKAEVWTRRHLGAWRMHFQVSCSVGPHGGWPIEENGRLASQCQLQFWAAVMDPRSLAVHWVHGWR